MFHQSECWESHKSLIPLRWTFRDEELVLAKWQTCSGWSLHPPPPPAHKATFCHSGTRLHTCGSRNRGRGRSSPYSPHPDSHTCPYRWRAVDLCRRTLCFLLQQSACGIRRKNHRFGDFSSTLMTCSLLLMSHIVTTCIKKDYSNLKQVEQARGNLTTSRCA